jgi:hypothetical protein
LPYGGFVALQPCDGNRLRCDGIYGFIEELIQNELKCSSASRRWWDCEPPRRPFRSDEVARSIPQCTFVDEMGLQKGGQIALSSRKTVVEIHLDDGL